MRAIVLVGGEGTRLRPLTWRTPKALVPVLGRPLLDHLLLHLREHCIEQVTLAMTQRNTAIREAYGAGERLGLTIDYAYEDTPLGSGGAIGAVAGAWRADGWQDETFAVVNGDVITDLDLSAMLIEHWDHNATLSIALHEVEDPSPFGVVEIGSNGQIHRFVEKPPAHLAPSRLINAGTWLLEPELIDLLDPTSFNRVEDGIFPSLCESGAAVFGFHQPCYWADVGNPAALLRVNLDLAAGQAGSGTVQPHTDRTYIAPTVLVAHDAWIGSAVIGDGSTIESSARITGSLLWDNVTVGTGASVEGSILASGVHVGAGARVVSSVVAHGVSIEAGASLSHEHIEPAGLMDSAAARTP